MGSSWLGAWRLLRVLACILGGVLIQLLAFPRWTPVQREQAVVQWARRMLAAMGVRVVLTGVPAAGPVVYVCNHVSWLDILVCHSQFFSCFVAKGEVHAWPLIGRMAQQAGTVFIERASRRDALRVVHHMADELRRQQALTVFPEGTTNDGLTVLPFHANLLQAAIVAEAPIQPMGLSYWPIHGSGQKSQAPRFVGEDTLLRSVWRTVCSPGVVARLHMGEPEWPGGRERRQWAAELQSTVSRLSAS
jgi:1-acyl-sn-glycerol-3-phosphate acyltransferase